jgi:hypothetical protein
MSESEIESRDFRRPPPPRYVYIEAPRTNGLAIASLVLGLVPVAGIGSILAVVFGCVALGQIRETGAQGRGMAIAGIWLGSIMLFIFFIALVAAVGG